VVVTDGGGLPVRRQSPTQAVKAPGVEQLERYQRVSQGHVHWPGRAKFLPTILHYKNIPTQCLRLYWVTVGGPCVFAAVYHCVSLGQRNFTDIGPMFGGLVMGDFRPVHRFCNRLITSNRMGTIYRLRYGSQLNRLRLVFITWRRLSFSAAQRHLGVFCSSLFLV